MRLSNITTALLLASNPVTTRRISEAPAVEPASRTAASAPIILRIMISLPPRQRRLFLDSQHIPKASMAGSLRGGQSGLCQIPAANVGRPPDLTGPAQSVMDGPWRPGTLATSDSDWCASTGAISGATGREDHHMLKSISIAAGALAF